MRHGNVADRRWLIGHLGDNFDPTYEAWKRHKPKCDGDVKGQFRSYLWGMETHRNQSRLRLHLPIPILPMRHGNAGAICGRPCVEADSDPTYEAWKPGDWGSGSLKRALIPILPMRHGNPHQEDTFPQASRFRSYLWGMETRIDKQIRKAIDGNSDPTYEAWKQTQKQKQVRWTFKYSDPTYEAWKLRRHWKL